MYIKELCDKSLVISYCYQHVLYTFLVTPEHPGIEGKFQVCCSQTLFDPRNSYYSFDLSKVYNEISRGLLHEICTREKSENSVKYNFNCH